MEAKKSHWITERLTYIQWGIVLLFIFHVSRNYLPGTFAQVVGSGLFVIGVFQIRHKNEYFKGAYLSAAGYFISRCVICVCNEIILINERNNFYVNETAFTDLAIQLLMLKLFFLFVRRGLDEEARGSGEEPYIWRHMVVAEVFTVLLLLLRIFTVNMIFEDDMSMIGIFIIRILLLVIICISLQRVKGHIGMIEAVEETKKSIRIHGSAVSAVILLVLILTPVVGYYAELVPIEATALRQDNNKEVVQYLKEAGFPEDILPYLSDEELAYYNGVSKVVVKQCEPQNLLIESEDDSEKLKITLVISELSESAMGDVRVLIFGEWTEQPKWRMNDEFVLSSALDKVYDENSSYGCYMDESGQVMQYSSNLDTIIPKQFGVRENEWMAYALNREADRSCFITADSYFYVDFWENKEVNLDNIEDFIYCVEYYHQEAFESWPFKNALESYSYYDILGQYENWTYNIIN